jgi:hypothetical protein
MHRKPVFVLAAVFLVIAIVIPPALVILQTNNTIYKYIVPGTNPTQGSTNITITITPQDRQNYNSTLELALIIEAVFIALFAITLFYGINHTHPEH